MTSDRVHKTVMNAKVGFVFYFLSMFLTFYSRRIFLECLGDSFMGLTTTLGSILNFLNITEIGIGTCIGYFLYKPIADQNHDKICEIVSLYGYLYRIIGTIVLVGGILVSASFPFIFAEEELSFGIIYFSFYVILGANLMGYFINYRQILLDSDQKNYKIAIWTQTGAILRTMVQILLVYIYKDPYLWMFMEIIFSLFSCLVLNHVIVREYPWLKTDKSKGREILKKYPEILQKSKQIVIHRLKNFFLSRSDEILIFAFESLQVVAFYGNYTMIVGKLTGLFNNVFVGMNASIGNLVAEGNKWNIRKVFWEYLTFRYWTTGIFIIGLTFLINPVIGWWLGPQYILADHIVILILLVMYVMLTRPSIDLFINAYGLYDDVWAAYAEGIINVTVTIVVGYFYGLLGILLGKVISLLFLVVIWKPYYLYHRGFNESVHNYWMNILVHYLLLLGCLLLNLFTERIIGWSSPETLNAILLYGLCITLPIVIVYSILIYLLCPGARDLAMRLKIRKNN
jgi:O-antigen/teichoic acid export membrane protein